jgi:6-phosphogluconolactonase
MSFTPFETRQAASGAAATYLTERLTTRLASDGRASLLVSGGSTPADCLRSLSDADLDWARVEVSPTDERCVAPTHEASNERMIRETLLRNRAADAHFKSLRIGLAEDIARQLACSLVGMGEDGHIASIFPDTPERDELLQVYSPPACRKIETTASEYARVTVNLPLLLSGSSVLLLIFGEAKREVLNRPDGMPVWHLLNQPCTPVDVYWAP